MRPHPLKKPKLGTEHTVEIKKLVYQGWGLAYIDQFVTFVPRTLPGEQVTIKIVKRKRDYALGKVLEFNTKSPHRISPACDHYPQSGGCQLQDVPYEHQLYLKTLILEDCLEQLTHKTPIPVKPIIGSESPYYYRNKMEFAFGQTESQLFIGLKERGYYDRVLPISTCKLLSEESNDILLWCQSFFSSQSTLTAWNPNTHTGQLRHLVMRHSKTTDTYMINLIVTKNHPKLFKNFAETLSKAFPNVKHILLTINTAVSDSTVSENSQLLKGHGYISETLENLTCQISPLSFFQTNTKQAETLYRTIRTLSNLKPTDTILDLYCGTGSIGLFLAKNVKQIIGIEENKHAIDNAKTNALNNGINNATFYADRVKNILKTHTFEVDCVIVDPPRSGMVPKAIRRLISLNAPKIVYVSCNPTTLVRDLNLLVDANYTIETLQPVDMFPNTYHLETISILTKLTA